MNALIPARALARRSVVSDEVLALPGVVAHLPSYDVIAVSTSGGKDSQAALSFVVELAEAWGIKDRVVAVHANLGRVEWAGTTALARTQAEALGVRFIEVTRLGREAPRTGNLYDKGETFGDLLDYARRNKRWPKPSTRWCTSEFKRTPILRAHTDLARAWKKAHPGAKRPCKVLEIMGMRAEESSRRAELPQMSIAKRGNSTRKIVHSWLPIQHWSEDQVWDRIRRSGLPHHRAYDLGMPRLSCVFCIFAPKAALVVAGRHNPDLLAEYVRIEREIGHTFKADLALAEVAEAVSAGEAIEPMTGDWNM